MRLLHARSLRLSCKHRRKNKNVYLQSLPKPHSNDCKEEKWQTHTQLGKYMPAYKKRNFGMEKGADLAVQRKLKSKHPSPKDANQFSGQTNGKTKELEAMCASENRVKLRRRGLFESL